MGATVCEAVEGADDMELSGRADPELGTALDDVLGDAEVVVDFTTPDAAPGNVAACLGAGVHCVVGTTGFDLDALRGRRPSRRPGEGRIASSRRTSRSARC